jgi:subtilisin family serine protease
MRIILSLNGFKIKQPIKTNGNYIFMKNKILLSIFLMFTFLFTSTIPVHAVKNDKLSFLEKKNKRQYKNKKLETRKKKVLYRRVIESSVASVGATVLHNNSYKGTNTYVAIIDSGVDSSHPLVAGKVLLEACFTALKSCPNGTTSQTGTGAARPIHWHGTHVAGIAAGYSSTYNGVAPEANIIAINVFDKDGSSSETSITKALNWILSISDKYNIAAVNMSLGTSRIYKSSCDFVSPPMTKAVHNLYDKNIATVVATGNSASIGMSNPACISKVVSVAASDLSSNITSFSNISTNTTFAAPGFQILSAGANGSMRRSSGTSMSTPHVTGIFALYKQIYPTHTIQQAVSRITLSSPLSYDPYSSIRIPSINVSNLLNATLDPPPPTTTVPPVTETTIQPPVSIPPPPILPAFKPNLAKLYTPSSNSQFFYINYQDHFVVKSLVKNYILQCNNNTEYEIPLNIISNVHVFKITSFPSFTACRMYALLNDATHSAYSSYIILRRA